MASGLQFIVLLCLLGGLWIGADADDCRRSCPSGWSVYGGRCFRVFRNKCSWAQAARYCTNQRGSLASVLNKNDYYFLRRLVYTKTHSIRPVWLGGQRNGYWLRSKSSRFTFRLRSKLRSRKLYNRRGRKGCMTMNYKGRFINNYKCSGRSAFICTRRA